MRPNTPYNDERLIRAALAGYLRYMRFRGLTDPRESLWTQKVAQGLGKPLKPVEEPGDALEAPEAAP